LTPIRLTGVIDQFSDGALVAQWRPVLLLRLIAGLIALLIARKWLRRIPGISRRLFESLDPRLQLPILFFQALDSRNQSFDRRHQIGAGNLIELVTSRRYNFGPRISDFTKPVSNYDRLNPFQSAAPYVSIHLLKSEI
jgi:hypothetical protein